MAIEANGLDELINAMEEALLDDKDMEKLLQRGGSALYKTAKEYIEKNIHGVCNVTYDETHPTLKRAKRVFSVYLGGKDAPYIFWGSSKVDKYIGYDENIMIQAEDKIFEAIEDELNRLMRGF